MLDKLVDSMLLATKDAERRLREEEERNKKVFSPSQLFLEREASSLAPSCKRCAKHHRERESHYVTELENAEKELREKGVSMEAFDQNMGAYMNYQNSIASGNVTGGQMSFQPRIDQILLDKVKVAKNKMLDHRAKAEQYEKYARAFFLADVGIKVKLSVEDITYFKLAKMEEITD